MKKYLHLLVFSLFLMGQGVALSQDTEIVAKQLSAIDKGIEYDTIKLACEPTDSFSSCAHKLFLSINRSASTGLNFLSSIDYEAPNGPQSSEVLVHTYIVHEGAARASTEELKLLLRQAKIKAPQINTPYYFLSDRQLLSSYHELLLTYHQNNQALLNTGKTNTETNLREVLLHVEGELIGRKLLPLRSNITAAQEVLLSKRLELSITINRLAVQEAVYFADNHPEVLRIRREVALLFEEVKVIEKELGLQISGERSYRDLFTDQTVKDRIASLEIGKKKIEYDISVERGYGANKLALLPVLEEALEAERNWFYKDHAKRILKSNISVRGPPVSFTFDDFFKKLNKKPKEITFKDYYQKECEKWNVLNKNNPEWKSGYNRISRGFMAPRNTSEYLKALSNEYYKTLPTLPEKAIQIEAEFKYISRKVNMTGAKIYEPIQSDIGALKYHESNLRLASRNLQTTLARMGNAAPTWLHQELGTLNEAINQLKKVKEGATDVANKSKLVLRSAGIMESRFEPLSVIQNEEVIMGVTDAKIKVLEVEMTKYGKNHPQRIERELADLKQTRLSNNNIKMIEQHRKYIPYVGVEKTVNHWENKGKYYGHQISGEDARIFSEKVVPAKEKIISSISEFDKSLRSDKVLRGMNERQMKDFLKIRKTINLDEPKTTITRPPQNSGKAELMKMRKNPGGIWLSPEKIPIPKEKSISQDWYIISSNETCKDGYKEWLLNNTVMDKICFPVTLPSDDKYNQTWIKSIGSWF